MPLRRSYHLNRLFSFTLVACDFVNVAVAILLAVRIRFGAFFSDAVTLSAMLGTWVFLVIMETVAMMVENLMVARTTVNRSMNIFRSIRMIFVVTIVYIVNLFLAHFPQHTFICSRLTVLIVMILWLIFTVVSRLLIIPKVFNFILRITRFGKIRILIFGEDSFCTTVKNTLLKSTVYRGVLDLLDHQNPLPPDPDERFKYCTEVMEKERASELMMIFDEEDFDHIARFSLLTRRAEIPFVIYSKRIPELRYFDPWLTIDNYGAMCFCSKEWTTVSRFLCRVVDILMAVAGLLLFLPLILVTVPLIAFTSKGGVLYRQTRIGYMKRAFTFYKFRSMRVDVEDRQKTHKDYFEKYVNGNAASRSKEGKIFKTISSKAVTPVGKIIRRTSIDELPQILNVLKGEMSIVGPRPCIEYELEHYKREWLLQRFTVKPGLTGVWQVYGRSRLSFEKSQFLDFVYVISRSDGLNIRLILKTFPVMLFGKGGL